MYFGNEILAVAITQSTNLTVFPVRGKLRILDAMGNSATASVTKKELSGLSKDAGMQVLLAKLRNIVALFDRLQHEK
jgi:hypothetical protein